MQSSENTHMRNPTGNFNVFTDRPITSRTVDNNRAQITPNTHLVRQQHLQMQTPEPPAIGGLSNPMKLGGPGKTGRSQEPVQLRHESHSASNTDNQMPLRLGNSKHEPHPAQQNPLALPS